MIKDPKQIVTPFAFEVHPDLLGLPLASPRRRLAALLLDLLIASILTALGAFFLATSASILFFWLAIRNRGKIWWKNFFRYAVASLVSILVFTLTYSITDVDDNESVSGVSLDQLEKNIVVGSNDNIDLKYLTDQLSSIKNNDSIDLDDQIEQIAKNLEETISGVNRSDNSYSPEMFNNRFISNLENLSSAITRNDSIAIDTLNNLIVPILAYSELNFKDERISKLNSRIDKLENTNDELVDQVNNPSFLRIIKATAEDFGLSLGWIGIYFVLCTAFFRGQTLGKRLLNLRVVRLNNKPIGFLYSFERFGGYAAGIATGLLGFAQVFWDSNRQGIHDKIAATVVIDTRKKVIEKSELLRKEILSDENLLD